MGYKDIKKARDELEKAIKVAVSNPKNAVILSQKSSKVLLNLIDENYDSGELEEE